MASRGPRPYPPRGRRQRPRVDSGRRFLLGAVVAGFWTVPAALHRLGQLTETARDQHRHGNDARRKGNEGTQEDNGEGEEGGQQILEATERVRSVSGSAASATPALDGKSRGREFPRPRAVDGVEVDVKGA